MAKTKQQQQQLLVIYLTICLDVVSLLMKVDSVSATMPLDGNGNILQQLHQPQNDNNEQQHNYMQGRSKYNPRAIEPKASDILVEQYNNNMKEKKKELIGIQLPLRHSLVKRTPAGFLGMRGKKLYDGDDNNTENDGNSYYLPWNQVQDYDENIIWNDVSKSNVRRNKKASTAFYGVRGKKFATMNGVNYNDEDNRWQDFLLKLEEGRARDAILQDFVERLAGSNNDLTSDMSKRAPTGFTGVRGKRPALDEYDSSRESLNKRALGNNEFIGVRGKKDLPHQALKRSPTAAERYFYGFWKKSLPARNGKHQRFVDLNNKFIAVRGKKSSFCYTPELHGDKNNNEPPLGDLSLRYDKGFIGMRGKRQSAIDHM